MTKFSDELLSAYLDGEATADERAAVEAQLATSEADRRMLEELRALRSEFQSLPRAAVAEGFADRVVRAAVAAKDRADASVSPAATKPMKRSLRWTYWAAAVALGLAVGAIVIVRNWPVGGGNNGNIVAAPSAAERLIEELRQAAPGEGEAVVVRLQVPKRAPLGQTLDVALAEAGLMQRPAFDVSSGAIQLGAAYRQKLGSKAPENLIAVSDALFINASLERIEEALKIIANDGDRMLNLAAEARLALADLPRPVEGSEGEAGSANRGEPFSQRLNAGMYRLERRDVSAAAPTAVPVMIDRTRSVKILILIEQVE